jgi:hypothetical protein
MISVLERLSAHDHQIGYGRQRRAAGLVLGVLLVMGGAFVSSGAHARAGFGAGTTYTLPTSLDFATSRG